MDAGMAERLAGSMDPKALSSLQNRNSDPAVARAVAAQFGSFMMQNMMQDGNGDAMSMAGGTGGAAVNSMFASAMGRFAMSGDKLGLADMIYRSTAGKTMPSNAPAADGPVASPAPAAPATQPAHSGSGISLAPYWQGNGHRPVGAPMGQMTLPTGMPVAAKVPAAHNKDDKTAHAPASAAKLPTLPRATLAATTVAAPAPAATTAATATNHADKSFWDWLGLPSLIHFIFPGGDSAAPPTSAAAAPTSGASIPSVPFGLPWSHPQTSADPPKPLSANGIGPTASYMSEAESFAQDLAPALTEAGQKLGVSPRVLLAQAALETGWGHAVVGNNIFGVKAGASWSGPTVAAKTHEMEGGRMVEHLGTFRAYPSMDQAVDDYVSLVSASDRYRAAIGAGDNVGAYGRALTAGGYASDRDYSAKLSAIANSATMSDAAASLTDDGPGQLVSSHG